ncbi:NDUFA12-domain-containing protein [Wallemia mellicola]|uniref:L-2-hydroxyglutarate dehydrogenase, mitochondrial n=2 Tax=Wallemia mellicola TaxID=1708541 RepID=A0A4T0UB58_9BASI|nr:NDUFA12-domain-containing protein [Wallemia mellicola]TIC32013.1 NDUFA12-domain-containing protein [Wallemia mellicola]TIC75429.1 NDUFA12-domain-containing protein [Wallemia mellicola]
MLKRIFPYKPPEMAVDHIIIGGGVVGLAVAQKLSQRFPTRSTYLIERHQRAGEETSSRNSEVIHAGIYYPQNSLKTQLCVRGRKLLYERCKTHNIDHKKTGKLVIGTSASQYAYLRKLHAHTQLPEVSVPTQLISADQALDYEPDLSKSVTAALYSPETSIIDSHGLDGSVKFGPDVEHLPESDAIDYWKEHLKPSEKNLPKVIEAVQKYLPGVNPDGFSPDQAGLRVKRNPPSSNQFSDFEIVHDTENTPGMISCYGIESPGLTACMAIAEEIERRLTNDVWGAGQSLYRHLRNWYRVGLRDGWAQLNEWVDVKAGRLAGTDKFGNRYYENLEEEMPEVPWRQRWVRYAQEAPLENASQVPSEWHAWLHHTRLNAPHEDEVVKKITAQTQHWRPAETHVENLTGTRGAFTTYNTTAPKLYPWQPKVAQRQ